MQVSDHAMKRFKQRGINPKKAVECYKKPVRIQQMDNGTVRYWHPTENLAIVVDHSKNMLVTVMRKEW